MEWINKAFIYCIIIISFCQCGESSLKKKDRIRIFYPLTEIETPYAIENCDMIFSIPILTDTIINDKEFINHLDSIISSLKPATDITDDLDFRIKCVIRYSNQTENIICLGENTGIVRDGIRMQDNEEIFKIINNVIYKERKSIKDPYNLPKVDYNKKW